MKALTIGWVVALVVVGVGVFITASQALAIVWGVLVLVGILTVTGVLGSVYDKLFGPKV